MRSKNALGQAAVYNYNALGEVTEIDDAMGNSVKFGYDVNGNMTSSTDQRNNTTSYAYDALNRRISRTDPLTNTETLSYNLAGWPDTFTARNGQISHATYDTAQRISQVRGPSLFSAGGSFSCSAALSSSSRAGAFSPRRR